MEENFELWSMHFLSLKKYGVILRLQYFAVAFKRIKSFDDTQSAYVGHIVYQF